MPDKKFFLEHPVRALLPALLIAGFTGILEMSFRLHQLGPGALQVGSLLNLWLLVFVTHAVIFGVCGWLLWLLAGSRLHLTVTGLTLALVFFIWCYFYWRKGIFPSAGALQPVSLLGIPISLVAASVPLIFLRPLREWHALGILATLTLLISAPLPFRIQAPAILHEEPNDPASRWVFVILSDTLGARHVSSLGYHRETTPVLDSFASESVVFEHAVAPASWTRPSVASLFTGLHPSTHRSQSGYPLLNDGATTIAERFADSGYITMGVSSNGNVSRFSNYDQGFQTFHDIMGRIGFWDYYWRLDILQYVATRFYPHLKDILRAPVHRRAEKVNQVFFNWFEERDRPGGLVYLQYMDAHEPYAPPAEFRTYGSEYVDLYDGEVRYWDSQLGELFKYLKEKNLYDDSVIIVTADHGEEFYEHGSIGHDHTVYEEVIHVPLFIKTPNSVATRIPTSVSLVDIAPTLASLAGLPPVRPCEGIDLSQTITEGVLPPDRLIRSESINSGYSFEVAWTRLPWKAIHHPLSGEIHLYNLEEDPLETKNVAHDNPEVVVNLLKEATKSSGMPLVVTSAPAEGEKPSAHKPDPESAKQFQKSIEALGYF